MSFWLKPKTAWLSLHPGCPFKSMLHLANCEASKINLFVIRFLIIKYARWAQKGGAACRKDKTGKNKTDKIYNKMQGIRFENSMFVFVLRAVVLIGFTTRLINSYFLVCIDRGYLASRLAWRFDSFHSTLSIVTDCDRIKPHSATVYNSICTLPKDKLQTN